jgi:hypothetical protein
MRSSYEWDEDVDQGHFLYFLLILLLFVGLRTGEEKTQLYNVWGVQKRPHTSDLRLLFLCKFSDIPSGRKHSGLRRVDASNADNTSNYIELFTSCRKTVNFSAGFTDFRGSKSVDNT